MNVDPQRLDFRLTNLWVFETVIFATSGHNSRSIWNILEEGSFAGLHHEQVLEKAHGFWPFGCHENILSSFYFIEGLSTVSSLGK